MTGRHGRSARLGTQSAFTLIEIMLALTIVGILALFAYPSYRAARLKAMRADGRTALMLLMQRQERHYTLHGRYRVLSSAEAEAQTDGAAHKGAGSGAYRLDAVPCIGQDDARRCIRLRATPAAGFSDPDCGVLTLDSDGAEGAAGKAGDGVPAICR